MPLSDIARTVAGHARGSLKELSLDLKVGCDRTGKTILKYCRRRYPLSVSQVFRLEDIGPVSISERAYLYRLNHSPGLLAGDALNLSLQLAQGSSLCLLDQSATKVHSMPRPGTSATVNAAIEIGDRATFEYLQAPTILYADSDCSHDMAIMLHPQGSLVLGEIVMPGRLARGELNEFRSYRSRIQVTSPEGTVLLTEERALRGQRDQPLSSSGMAGKPVLGTLILMMPERLAGADGLVPLKQEITTIVNLCQVSGLEVSSSVLPGESGLLLRARSPNTRQMQACFKAVLSGVRRLRHQAPLPYSVRCC